MLLEKNAKEPNNDHLVEVNLLEMSRYFWAHRYMFLIIACLVSSSILLWSVFAKITLYKSSAIVQISTEGKSEGLFSSMTELIEDREVGKKMFAMESVFSSKAFRQALYDEVEGRTHRLDGVPHVERYRHIIRDYYGALMAKSPTPEEVLFTSLTVLHEKDNDALIINALTTHPLVSQALASLASQLFVNVNYAKVKAQVTSIKNFLQQQTFTTRQQLNDLENQLSKIQLQEKVLGISELSPAIDKEQFEMQATLQGLKNKVLTNSLLLAEYAKDRKEYVEHIKNESDSYLYTIELQKKIELLKYRKEVATSDRELASEGPPPESLAGVSKEFDRMGDDSQGRSPTMNPWEYLQMMEKDITDLKSKQRQLKGEVDATEKAIHHQDTVFSAMPEKMQRLNSLKRTIELTSKLYSNLQAKLQETEVREAGLKNNAALVSPAEFPLRSEGTGSTVRLVLALVAGFTAATILILGRYTLVPTLRNKNDLNVHGIACIGQLPFYTNKFMAKGFPLILKQSPLSAIANSLRNICFRLEVFLEDNLQKNRDGGCVLTLFGLNSKEGRSFIGANLAQALKTGGKKVLLLDLNNADSQVRKYFKVAAELEQAQPPLELDATFKFVYLENDIHLIESVPDKDSVFNRIKDEHFGVLIAQLKLTYDIIIVDTPSLKSHFEPLISSRYSDALILVTSQRTTLRNDVARSVESVRDIFKGPICSVLNFSFDESNVA